ncbi:hypothetical protein SDC9_202867 [bioreactor metagenome]|uniref:Uncharacterized protein n=1 Tax=bioreactor metagenome TaxID=1076179 RepID=A0A645IUV3_9ZZZZ
MYPFAKLNDLGIAMVRACEELKDLLDFPTIARELVK